jgi:hypothetical protein
VQPDRDVGVIVLTNAQNMGYPDAIGLWLFDCILDNPEIDYVGNSLPDRMVTGMSAFGWLNFVPDNSCAKSELGGKPWLVASRGKVRFAPI